MLVFETGLAAFDLPYVYSSCVMASGAWCPWRKQQTAGNQRREPKSVNLFLGFFFLVNYSLGVGNLGLPYSFLYAGHLVAIPTLLVVAILTWIHASWVLEVMARAQALESFSNFQRSFGDLGGTEKTDLPPLEEYCGSVIDIHKLHRASTIQPDFRIVRKRCFEPSELCEIFFGKTGKYLYLIILTIFSGFNLLLLATVAGTVWATNIPLNFGPFLKCQYDAFHLQVIPELESCKLTYYLCLCLFASVVVPLSLMSLKEHAIIQTIFGVMRVLLVVLIVLYSTVKLLEGGNICEHQERPTSSNASNHSESCGFEETERNVTAGHILEPHDIIVRFDWSGWLMAIPVFTWPFLVHQSIPSFTHPIKQKRYIWHFILCTFAFVVFILVILGIVPPLWFSAETQEAISLNWVKLTAPCNSPQLRALSYYIILIPSVQASTIFPLHIHLIASNIYSVFLGPGTCKRQHKCDWALKCLIKVFAAVLPISAAFGISNLVQVVQYGGLTGFALGFIIPSALQLQSIRVCKRTFLNHDVKTVQTQFNADPTDNKLSGTAVITGSEVFHSSQGKKLRSDSSLYMTPYSTRILSHPIAVSIIGAIGGLLFLLSIAGVFVQQFKPPNPLNCTLNELV